MMRLSLFLLLMPAVLRAQVAGRMSLQQAYDLAQKNYPAIKQKDLVRQMADLSIENLSKGYLPQVLVNAQATYQSDVTSIKGSIIPGVNVQAPEKDQYKITADLSQVIYDGGVIKQEKIARQIDANVELQRVEVELYQLRDRVNQLYFGILYFNEQLQQIELVKQDISTGIKTVEAQVNNGVAFKSNLNVLKAEWLKTDQRRIDVAASRKGLIDALAMFVGQPLPNDLILEKPYQDVPADWNGVIARPELRLFDSKSDQLFQQNKLIGSRLLPRASVFAQGGYGRPGLNMLENSFEFFYLGGVRLTWSLSGLYTQKRDKELVKVNQQINDVQRETFILNTNMQLKQQASDIDKLDQLIKTDSEIIALRQSVKEAARAQLENGVITSNDYLREVNAEDQARNALIAHEVQWAQAKVAYKTTLGK